MSCSQAWLNRIILPCGSRTMTRLQTVSTIAEIKLYSSLRAAVKSASKRKFSSLPSSDFSLSCRVSLFIFSLKAFLTRIINSASSEDLSIQSLIPRSRAFSNLSIFFRSKRIIMYISSLLRSFRQRRTFILSISGRSKSMIMISGELFRVISSSACPEVQLIISLSKSFPDIIFFRRFKNLSPFSTSRIFTVFFSLF